MQRALTLLTLPALACGFLGSPASATHEPLSTTLPTPAPTMACGLLPCGLQGTPTVSPARPEPIVTPAPPDAVTFPDSEAYLWPEIVRGLERPVDIQAARDGTGLLFILEKPGRIRILQDDQVLSRPFLNIVRRVRSSDKEQGLLGLAFHPRYAENGNFYVNYTAAGSGHTIISRFKVSDDPLAADPASEVVLLQIDQPYVNHNGGALAFGPDGYLYAALGDGGGIGDPFDHAQDTGSLLGKILRLDVDRAGPYAIPPDNPFGNEVWAYGLRNPWRFSFDRANGDLYIADVGHLDREEINHVPVGTPGGWNFGWDYFEGSQPYSGTTDPDRLSFPVVEYSHEQGCAVVGGYVYRGAMSEWNGIYMYGDYCLGTIWGWIEGDGDPHTQRLYNVRTTLTTFGQDEAGELYFATDEGRLHRFIRK